MNYFENLSISCYRDGIGMGAEVSIPSETAEEIGAQDCFALNLDLKVNPYWSEEELTKNVYEEVLKCGDSILDGMGLSESEDYDELFDMLNEALSPEMITWEDSADPIVEAMRETKRMEDLKICYYVDEAGLDADVSIPSVIAQELGLEESCHLCMQDFKPDQNWSDEELDEKVYEEFSEYGFVYAIVEGLGVSASDEFYDDFVDIVNESIWPENIRRIY